MRVDVAVRCVGMGTRHNTAHTRGRWALMMLTTSTMTLWCRDCERSTPHRVTEVCADDGSHVGEVTRCITCPADDNPSATRVETASDEGVVS